MGLVNLVVGLRRRTNQSLLFQKEHMGIPCTRAHNAVMCQSNSLAITSQIEKYFVKNYCQGIVEPVGKNIRGECVLHVL